MQILTTLKPSQPSSQEWMDLKSSFSKNESLNAIIDIIIPVYGATNDTLRCIYSVIKAKNTTPFNLIVIEDCGPEPELRIKLAELSDFFHFTYLENETNKGFVLTCNRAFQLNQNRDVILLNSDTEVFDGWLDRIVNCATINPKSGTITAMSNNATIASYPFFCNDYSHHFEISDKELDQIFAKVNKNQSVTVPTGIGFCMYVRRACLKEIGLFNYDLFGKGYGEENDLCMRAKNAGWDNLIANDVFVRHYGSSSFSNSVREERVKHALEVINKEHPTYLTLVEQFIKSNPMKPHLLSIDKARLAKFIEGKSVFLQITHNYGGGTEKHHLEMTEKLSQEGFAVISLKPTTNNGYPTLHLQGIFPCPNLEIPLGNPDELNDFFTNTLNVNYIHIHHLIGYVDIFHKTLVDTLQLKKIPYYFTVHDYYPICPRINLMNDNLYCGEPNADYCNQCVNGMEELKPFNNNIDTWRDNYEAIMIHADKVFVPDEDVRWRLKRYFPNLETLVRPHFENWKTKNISINNQKQIRIGIIGAIGIHKGFYQLYTVAQHCKNIGIDIEFIIIGYSADDNLLTSIGNIKITGQYTDDELFHIIEKSNLTAVWFPAVCPETYSYTLSAILATNLPIIAYDFGAIARRLKNNERGILVPVEVMLKPQLIIKYFLQDFSQYVYKPQAATRTYQSITSDYYGIAMP